MIPPSKTLWGGMVNVSPEEGNDMFEGAPGAYTNALGLAGSEHEFVRLVREHFRAVGLRVLDVDDVGPVDIPTLGPDWSRLAFDLSETSPVVHDTFYVYETAED